MMRSVCRKNDLPAKLNSRNAQTTKAMNLSLQANEPERLAALDSYSILDTPVEQACDDLAQLAALACGTPIALISLVASDRVWFKSVVGLAGREASRATSFCAQAILNPEQMLIVPDASKDQRFSENPFVVGEPQVRFYAGLPLAAKSGHPIGTLCVLDRVPRELNREQRDALAALGRQVMAQLELRRHRNDLENRIAERTRELIELNQALQNEIASRIQSEAKLRESSAQIYDLYHHAPCGYHSINANGVIIEINEVELAWLGYRREEIVGCRRSVEFLSPASQELFYREFPAYVARGWVKDLEIEIVRRDGAIMNVVLNSTVVRDAEGRFLRSRSTLFDVTARRRMEQQLEASLREKEILLREIHHRVKNNMQVVISMLNLQTRQLQDAATRAHFRETQQRIRSMAMIHERLYQSSSLAQINFADYTRDLAVMLFRTYQTQSTAVRLETEINSLAISLDHAVPLGLLLNELISNCLKHAFPEGRSGTIKVTLRSEADDALSLVVQDDGVGPPADFDFDHASSFGLRLTRLLARQLEGVLTTRYGGEGTEVALKFRAARAV